MAKKSFNLGEQKNLAGGGINNFFPKDDQSVEARNIKEPVTEEVKPLIKTFSILEEDFDFLNKYILYKGFKEGTKYTQKMGLKDAIDLLRKKYPDVK